MNAEVNSRLQFIKARLKIYGLVYIDIGEDVDKVYNILSTSCKEVDEKYYLFAAMFNQGMGLESDAKRLFMRAIERGDSDAMVAYGWLCKSQGKHIEAEEYLLMACNNMNADNLLGQLYLESGYGDEAEKFYDRAIKSGDVRGWNNYGYLYEVFRYDKVKAVEYYLVGISLGCPIAMENYGCILRDKGDWSGAEKYYIMALENGSRNCVSHIISVLARRASCDRGLGSLSVLYVLKKLYKLTGDYKFVVEAQKIIKDMDATIIFNLISDSGTLGEGHVVSMVPVPTDTVGMVPTDTVGMVPTVVIPAVSTVPVVQEASTVPIVQAISVTQEASTVPIVQAVSVTQEASTVPIVQKVQKAEVQIDLPEDYIIIGNE